MAREKRKDCERFGKLIKRRLIELEMTQIELSKLSGIHQQYLSLIINGKRPGLKHREKIRSILCISSVRESINKCFDGVDVE